MQYTFFLHIFFPLFFFHQKSALQSFQTAKWVEADFWEFAVTHACGTKSCIRRILKIRAIVILHSKLRGSWLLRISSDTGMCHKVTQLYNGKILNIRALVFLKCKLSGSWLLRISSDTRMCHEVAQLLATRIQDTVTAMYDWRPLGTQVKLNQKKWFKKKSHKSAL